MKYVAFCTGFLKSNAARSVSFRAVRLTFVAKIYFCTSRPDTGAAKTGEGGGGSGRDLQKFCAGVRPMQLRSCREEGGAVGLATAAAAAAFANFQNWDRDIFANFSFSEATRRRDATTTAAGRPVDVVVDD